jgi:NTE family protein
MRRIGLVLGGGGIVGIAWELGVMSALQDHAGLDPLAMEIIVGTSAGSVAGAQVALGKELGDLVAQQQRPPQAPGPASASGGGSRPSQIGTGIIPEEIMRLFFQNEGTMEERALTIAALASDVPLALSEGDYVESFRRMLGTDEWPAVDLRATTTECESGRSVVWTKSDGIDLVTAVASSCAIPGYFPRVRFGDHHYMDGPRGGFYGDMVREKSLDALLFIGPFGDVTSAAGHSEFDVLAAEGLPVVQVTGGERLIALGTQLMDPRARPLGAEIGLEDGQATAAEVGPLFA